MGWEHELLGDVRPKAPPAPPAPLAPTEPKPKPLPLFANTAAHVAQGMRTLADTAQKAKKAVYVKLPCFTC